MSTRQAMTSKERILAAMRGEEVDRIPIRIGFWPGKHLDELASEDLDVRFSAFQRLGIDFHVSIGHGAPKVPKEKFSVRITEEKANGESYPLLKKEIDTPSGTLSAIVYRTDDWEAGNDIRLFDDFNSARFKKPWVEDKKDVDALAYLFSSPTEADIDAYRMANAQRIEFARERGLLLEAVCGSGLDAVMWLCGAEKMVLMAVDQPELFKRLIGIISEYERQWQAILLDLGADCIFRRGWYESADFWSPTLYRKFALPNLLKEVEVAHQRGKPFCYIMCTGLKPLIPILREEATFDCLAHIEPILGGQSLDEIIPAMHPSKSILGGISAPEHLGRSNPAIVRVAVRHAFEVIGHRGFILGCSGGIRPYFPWENVLAMIDEWKQLADCRASRLRRVCLWHEGPPVC